MTQLSPKFLCCSMLALFTLAAACKQAPVRPTTINLRDRRGEIDESDSTKDPKPTKPTREIPDKDPEPPVDDPEKPVIDPEKPVIAPEKPVVDPEKPVVVPEKPVVTPEKPVEPEKPKEPKVSELFTEAQFNQMLPHRIPFYTYKGFIDAAEATPGFAKEGTIEARKREIAAILANARHESDEFRATREYNMAAWSHYCMASAEYPCTAGQTYQGRGPIQLSWNYNYKDAGIALGIDLLNNPDLVATDPKVAFQTMMWFWMKRGTVTCHAAMINPPNDQAKGFAQTIRTINGGLECNPKRTAVQREQAQKRGTFYKETLAAFGLNAGNEYLDCI